jgi:hypothetical protein
LPLEHACSYGCDEAVTRLVHWWFSIFKWSTCFTFLRNLTSLISSLFVFCNSSTSYKKLIKNSHYKWRASQTLLWLRFSSDTCCFIRTKNNRTIESI